MEAKCSGRSFSDSETLKRNGAVMNEPTASTLAIDKLMLYLSPAPLKGWWGIVVFGQ